MNERKSWDEMTPAERHVDRLRHFSTMLNRWQGGRAKFWSFNRSHAFLVIRIERDGVKGNLEIACGDLIHVHAPSNWQDIKIEVALSENEKYAELNNDGCMPYVVRDINADVEITCSVVEIAENVKPIY